MAIKDIFKKENDSEKEKKALPLKEVKKPESKKIVVDSSRILKGSHITEKATKSLNQNQYSFKVFNEANKIEIKKAIEKIYKVNVVSVQIINISGKKRRVGKIKGVRPGYKKAIVKIKKGQKIESLLR